MTSLGQVISYINSFMLPFVAVVGLVSVVVCVLKAIHLRGEIVRLRGAIEKHRNQRGDDRCWLDDLELYAVLGDGAKDFDPVIGMPWEEFGKNCRQFHALRSELPMPEAVRRYRARNPLIQIPNLGEGTLLSGFGETRREGDQL